MTFYFYVSMSLLEKLAALRNRFSTSGETKNITTEVSTTDETQDAITVPLFANTNTAPYTRDAQQRDIDTRLTLINPYRGLCAYPECRQLVDPRNDGFYFLAIFRAMEKAYNNTRNLEQSILAGEEVMRRVAEEGRDFSQAFSQKYVHKHMYPLADLCNGSASLQKLLEGHSTQTIIPMADQKPDLMHSAYRVLQSAEILIR